MTIEETILCTKPKSELATSIDQYLQFYTKRDTDTPYDLNIKNFFNEGWENGFMSKENFRSYYESLSADNAKALRLLFTLMNANLEFKTQVKAGAITIYLYNTFKKKSNLIEIPYNMEIKGLLFSSQNKDIYLKITMDEALSKLK